METLLPLVETGGPAALLLAGNMSHLLPTLIDPIGSLVMETIK